MATRRQAWLTLGDVALPLDDAGAGYACTELDLGYPEVREVSHNRPDFDGADDQTALFGPRSVTMTVVAWRGGAQELDDIVSLFTPFLSVRARPVLHLTEQSSTDREKLITLRAQAMGSPMTPPYTRVLNMSFVAADPYLYDATARQVAAWSGSTSPPGRTYDLTFDRWYPPGGGAPVTGYIINGGDVVAFPTFRIFGPVSEPTLSLVGQRGPNFSMQFRAGFEVDQGHHVAIDTAERTALVDGDPARPVLSQVIWGAQGLVWPALLPLVRYEMHLSGENTSGVTQVIATWREGFLS